MCFKAHNTLGIDESIVTANIMFTGTVAVPTKFSYYGLQEIQTN